MRCEKLFCGLANKCEYLDQIINTGTMCIFIVQVKYPKMDKCTKNVIFRSEILYSTVYIQIRVLFQQDMTKQNLKHLKP